MTTNDYEIEEESKVQLELLIAGPDFEGYLVFLCYLVLNPTPYIGVGQLLSYTPKAVSDVM